MPEADVLYSDVKFKKGRGKTADTTSPSEETTYSEIQIKKTQPPSEPPVSQQPAETNAQSKFPSERVALVVLSCLLFVALITLAVTVYLDMDRIKTLTDEMKNLKKNLTETLTYCQSKPCSTVPPQCPDINEVAQNRSCLKCETGWEQHGGHCYHFSTSSFIWSKSRDECISLGGNLVKIDSRDEQDFLEKRLRDKMSKDEDKFWIGLTDSETEGQWLWVDGSKLNQSLEFWRKGEPDNWEGRNKDYPEGEDCVRMGEKRGSVDMKIWNDKSCTIPQKHICEKKVKTGHFTCV